MSILEDEDDDEDEDDCARVTRLRKRKSRDFTVSGRNFPAKNVLKQDPRNA